MFLLFTLDEWWQLLSPAQHVFWIIALLFSVLFIIMFGLSLLGLNTDSDADVEVDHGSAHDFSVDKDFSAFSIRSIIAFFTFFGWTGVYLLSQGRGLVFATAISALAGSTAMFVVAYMIYKFAQMEKSGTVDVLNALEQTGEVYLSIPQNLEGKGKIHIVVDGSLHEFDAETKGQSLMTGSQVRVVEILENEVLLVEPVILEIEQ
ncbi:MAG TPA: hypothetical protein VI603_04985 [Saprospiraceae bacterium]|nr:hypothetical protein [Saprospiraceae bacterium]